MFSWQLTFVYLEEVLWKWDDSAQNFIFCAYCCFLVLFMLTNPKCLPVSEFIVQMFLSANRMIWVIRSRKMRWLGSMGCVRDMKGAYRVLVARPEGKRPLGKT